MRNELALLLASATLAGLVPAARAQDDARQVKELADVLSAQQLSCGKVLHYDAQGTRDFLVHCQDGSIYEVLANSSGKLVATLIAKQVQPVK